MQKKNPENNWACGQPQYEWIDTLQAYNFSKLKNTNN